MEPRFVPLLEGGLRDCREVRVTEAGGEAVGVEELHVVQKVCVAVDGAGDLTFFYLHVKGVSHDTAVRKARVAPHPGALLQAI